MINTLEKFIELYPKWILLLFKNTIKCGFFFSIISGELVELSNDGISCVAVTVVY